MLVTAIVVLLIWLGGGYGITVGGGDLYGYFVPKFEYVTRALFVEHRLPLWNPYEFNGLPLLGSHQANTFYAPTWLTFGLLPTFAALQAFNAIHVFVLAWGMIAYLRLHGVPRPVGVLGVLIAAAGAFTGHGQVGVDHPMQLGSMAWFPAILLFWEKSVFAVRPWLGWMAVAVAGQWIAGYPDFGLNSPFILGVLALVGVAKPDGDTHAGPSPAVVRRLTVLVAGLALGGLLAAVQLLPTAETVARSARGLVGVDHTEMRRLVLIETWGALPTWTIGRVGLATVVLALVALLRPTRAALGWAAALAFTLLVGFAPLRWLYVLPVFSSIRLPLAWDLLGGVFWGFLACAGVAIGLRSTARWIRAAVVVLALWAAGFSAYLLQNEPRALRFPMPDPVLYETRARSLAEMVRRAPASDTRIVSPRDAAAGSPIRHELSFVASHEPTMPPARLAELFGRFYPGGVGAAARVPVYRNPRLASLLGVGIAVIPSRGAYLMERAGFEKVGSLAKDVEPDDVWYQPPIPRARIVRRFVIAPGREDALAKTADPERDMLRTAVLSRAPPEVLAQLDPTNNAGDEVRIVTSEAERVVLEARLEQPGLLVLMDTFSPNWTATVDGETADLLVADYAFRGVPVPAGEHRIVFEYNSLAVWAGALLTILSALVVGTLVWPRSSA